MAKSIIHAEAVLTGSAAAPVPEKKPLDKESAFSHQRVKALAKRQMNLLASLETKVLRNEKPGAIHDLRVASRRLQQILDLLYPKPRGAKMRKIRRTMRRARRSLSAVRNTDVLLKKVEQHLDRKRLAHRDVWTAFREYLQERRDAQMRKAGRKLGRLNLSASYVHVKAALAAAKGPARESTPKPIPKQAPKPAPMPAIVARISGRDLTTLAKAPQDSQRPELRTLLTESLLQSWEVMSDRVAQSQKEPSAETIHAVRIAGKKLRYLIEVMQALRVAGSDPALDWLRHLQRHLGDWHDLEVMEQTMIDMVARPKFLKEHLELGVEAEKLVLRNRKTKQAYQDRFFEMVEQKVDWETLRAWIHSFAGRPGPAETPLIQSQVPPPVKPVETQAG